MVWIKLLLMENHLNLYELIKKQLKIANTFLTGCNGIFNHPDKNNKFYFALSITHDGIYQMNNPKGAYESESLDEEIERIFIVEGLHADEYYPFLIKTSFSTLGSIIETSNEGPLNSFVHDDSLRDF